MGSWHSNLLNSPIDVAIDSTLLLAIASSYIPQITRIVRSRSTNGISPWFITLNALFSNLQLANILILVSCSWPNGNDPALDLISNGQLRGFEAFGAVLGLIQVALLSACSIITLTFYVAYPANNGASTSLTTRISVFVITFIHAYYFLFPIIRFALPKAPPSDLGRDIRVGLFLYYSLPVSLALVALQFLPQYLELRRQTGDPGSLSLLALYMQAVVQILVAMRWLQRLGPTAWDFQTVLASILWQGNWLNYIVGGIGSAILMYMYLRAKQPYNREVIGEKTPLLA